MHEPAPIALAVELYTLSKSFSMAGWRVAFLVGNPAVVAGLTRLKSWLDYGTFQPIQIAAIAALTDAPDTPDAVAEVYRERRDVLCDGLARVGWEIHRPRATMFAWAAIPERFRSLGSVGFAELLAREAHVAVSPGAGSGCSSSSSTAGPISIDMQCECPFDDSVSSSSETFSVRRSQSSWA